MKKIMASAILTLGALTASAQTLVVCYSRPVLYLVLGLIFCLTIVGIPRGAQHLKMALVSIFPFGKEIR